MANCSLQDKIVCNLTITSYSCKNTKPERSTTLNYFLISACSWGSQNLIQITYFIDVFDGFQKNNLVKLFKTVGIRVR